MNEKDGGKGDQEQRETNELTSLEDEQINEEDKQLKQTRRNK